MITFALLKGWNNGAGAEHRLHRSIPSSISGSRGHGAGGLIDALVWGTDHTVRSKDMGPRGTSGVESGTWGSTRRRTLITAIYTANRPDPTSQLSTPDNRHSVTVFRGLNNLATNFNARPYNLYNHSALWRYYHAMPLIPGTKARGYVAYVFYFWRIRNVYAKVLYFIIRKQEYVATTTQEFN